VSELIDILCKPSIRLLACEAPEISRGVTEAARGVDAGTTMAPAAL
jgi:hypothetical protein